MKLVCILAIFLSFNLNATNYHIGDAVQMRSMALKIQESRQARFGKYLSIKSIKDEIARDGLKTVLKKENEAVAAYNKKVDRTEKNYSKYINILKKEEGERERERERERETIKKAQILDPRVDSIPSDANSTFSGNNNGTFPTSLNIEQGKKSNDQNHDFFKNLSVQQQIISSEVLDKLDNNWFKTYNSYISSNEELLKKYKVNTAQLYQKIDEIQTIRAEIKTLELQFKLGQNNLQQQQIAKKLLSEKLTELPLYAKRAVTIKVTIKDDDGNRLTVSQSLGFIYSGEYIITNYHALFDNTKDENNYFDQIGEEIEVHLLAYDKTIETEILFFDCTKDIAILKAKDPIPKDLKPLAIHTDHKKGDGLEMWNSYETISVTVGTYMSNASRITLDKVFDFGQSGSALYYDGKLYCVLFSSNFIEKTSYCSDSKALVQIIEKYENLKNDIESVKESLKRDRHKNKCKEKIRAQKRKLLRRR